MDRRFSRSGQTKSVERGYNCTNDWFVRQAADAAPYFSSEASCHLRKQKKASKVDLCSTSSDDSTTEEESSSCELNRSLCQKIDGIPIYKRTNEVVSRVVEKRPPSPSVIARLMGLDDLYPQAVSELKNENGNFLLKKPSDGLQEKFECFGNHSFHVSKRKRQNFKFVHGLCDSSKTEQINQVVQKEKDYPKADMAFIKLQFMKAKHVPTNEVLQNSKEFNDVVESSAVNCRENSETTYKPVEITKGYTQKKEDFAHGYANTSISLGNRSTYDYADSLLHKLLRSQYTGKRETSHPTSIVVIKPSVQKVQSTGRTESCPRSLQNYKPSRRHRELHRGFLVEREGQHRLFHVNSKGCKAKATAEIASDISVQTKQSLKRHSAEALASKIDIYNPSSPYMSEPPLNGVAMNGLSERWRTTKPSRHRLIGESSSTLGKMFSPHDKEAPQTLAQLIFKKSDKIPKKYLHDSWVYTSGISSSDDLKDECDAFLPISDDHHNSSALYGSLEPENGHQVGCFNPVDDCNTLRDMLNQEQNDWNNSIMDRGHSMLRNFKHRDKNLEVGRPRGVENKRPVNEVEMGQEASRDVINLNNLIEPKPVYLQRNMDDLLHLVHNFSNPKNFESDKSFWCNMKEFQQSAKYKDLSVSVLENEVPKVAAIDFPLVESPLEVTKYGAFIEPNIAERLSPVSVLDTRAEDGKSTPECLEMIRAGLHDLRRQLNLLEMETVDLGDEQSKSLMFNDDAGSEILKSLKDGDGRDFLYLLDVLAVSGFYASGQNKFFDAFYLSDNPVFPDVFDKLEKKYSMVNLWSRSERRLLFDHINSVLAKVLAPCIDLHPWVKLRCTAFCGQDRLVNESWRLLLQQMKELSKGRPEDKVLDTKWLYLDDHLNMIGREIERMLKDDLLNELVFEFFSG